MVQETEDENVDLCSYSKVHGETDFTEGLYSKKKYQKLRGFGDVSAVYQSCR